jgi:hypothetical protein
MSTIDDIYNAAMGLPLSQQAELLDRLSAGLQFDPELDEETEALIADRIAAYRRGEVALLDGNQVLDEIERSLDPKVAE